MKMYFKNIIVILALVGFSTKGISQDKEVTQILQKVTDYYNNTTQISLQMKYELRRGRSGSEVTESYTGTYLKKGAFSKLSLLDSDIIHFEEVKLVVDNDSKAIEYSKASQLTPNNPIDISTFIKYYEKSSVRNNGDELICELQSESFSNLLPYNRVLLYIDKKDYSIKKQELFFSKQLPFKSREGKKEEDFGRLVITLSKVKALNDTLNDKLNNYVVKNGDKLLPSLKYKGYQIINQVGKI